VKNLKKCECNVTHILIFFSLNHDLIDGLSLSRRSLLTLFMSTGQVSMQKVKVNRYVSGKRPDYAQRSSSEDDSEEDEFIVPHRMKKLEEEDLEEVSISSVFLVC